MSTATAPDLTLPLIGGRYHFLMRRMHSLTGLVFGGYLVVHLIVNATIAQAGTVFQVQVNRIHDLPLLWALEWGLIYLPIIYHTIYGIWITATGQPNPMRYQYTKNWFYFLQRVSAIIIVLFMVFHVLSLKYGVFGEGLRFRVNDAAASVHQHITYNFLILWVVYPLGILASCFHMANGLWTAAITWGLTISHEAQRRFGMICLAIFIFMMVLGMTALVAAARWTPPEPGAPVEEIPSIVP